MPERIYHTKGECPRCGERDDIDCGTPQVDGPDAWVECECQSCGCRFTDHYRLCCTVVATDD